MYLGRYIILVYVARSLKKTDLNRSGTNNVSWRLTSP